MSTRTKKVKIVHTERPEQLEIEMDKTLATLEGERYNVLSIKVFPADGRWCGIIIYV